MLLFRERRLKVTVNPFMAEVRSNGANLMNFDEKNLEGCSLNKNKHFKSNLRGIPRNSMFPIGKIGQSDVKISKPWDFHVPHTIFFYEYKCNFLSILAFFPPVFSNFTHLTSKMGHLARKAAHVTSIFEISILEMY